MNLFGKKSASKGKSKRLTKFDRWRIKRSFNVNRRCEFYADMASFVAESITPFKAMERMRKVAAKRRSMRWLDRLLEQVMKPMENEGKSLAGALAPWIPPQEAALLDAGEKGAQLKEALKELASLLQIRREVTRSLVANLFPAAAKLIVMVALMVYILNTVMKEAKSLIDPEMFEKLTLAPLYFGFGEVVLTSLPFLLVTGVAVTVAVAASLGTWKPNQARRWLDRNMPPYTMATRIQASYFLITVSSMMEAGTTFKGAVEQIGKHANPWLKTHLRRVLKRLSGGTNEAQSLQTGLLPWDVEDRIFIYELLDEFKRIMRVTARDSMASLLTRVKFLGGALNATATVLLGLFIIFTIFSIGEIALEAQSSINKVQHGN